MQKNLVVIVGPTAIGKTDVGIMLAKHLDTEIISADSRQIFKELNAGTAKPSNEQLAEVKHHFISNKSIYDEYNASKYEFEVMALLNKLFKKHQYIVMVGGSGLYIDAVCKGIDDIPSPEREIRNSLLKQHEEEGIEGLRLLLKKLDPEYYEVVDLKNPNRIIKALEISILTGKPYSSFLSKKQKKRDFSIQKTGLNINRDILYDRINKRVDIMVEQGLIDEARSLYPVYKAKGLNALKTVGYKELFDHFDGRTTLEEAISLIKRNTRRYARRQITWFRKDKNIKWYSPNEYEQICEYFT